LITAGFLLEADDDDDDDDDNQSTGPSGSVADEKLVACIDGDPF
jgi:hypothetical protein